MPREIKIHVKESENLPVLADEEYRVYYLDIDKRARQVLESVLNSRKRDLSFSKALRIFEIHFQGGVYYYLINFNLNKMLVIRNDDRYIAKVVQNIKSQIEEKVHSKYFKQMKIKTSDNFIIFQDSDEEFDYSKYEKDTLNIKVERYEFDTEVLLIRNNKTIQVLVNAYAPWHFVENLIYFKFKEAD